MKRIKRPMMGLLVLALLFGSPAVPGMADPCGSWTRLTRDQGVHETAHGYLSSLAGEWTALNAAQAPHPANNPGSPAVARQALYLDASLTKHAGLAVISTDFHSSSVLDGDFERSAEPMIGTSPATLATARVNGGHGNAFARGQWIVDWSEGTHYRSEMSVFLPEGFYAHQQGAVQLMGWDTFPVLNNHMRLIIWKVDQRARLFLKSDGADSALSSAFTIPEGRWVRIALEQRIAAEDGWSRVYLDGELVAQGTGHTSTPHPVTRMRYGLVAIDAAAQALPLSVGLRDVLLVTLPAETRPAPLEQAGC